METAVETARPEVGILEGVAQRTATRPRARSSARRAWPLTCLATDAGMLALAGVATVVGDRVAGVATVDIGWTVLFALLALGLYSARGLYGTRIGLRPVEDVGKVVVATTVAAMAVLSLRLLLGAPSDLAAESLRPWAFALVYVAAGRAALYWSQIRARRDGESAQRTLIVGAGRIGSLAARRLLEHPEIGLRPVAFLDKEPLADPEETLGIPVAGASWDLDSVAALYGIEHVVITFSTAPDDVLLRLVRRCEDLGLSVSIVPRLFEKVPERITVDHLGGLPLVTARPADPKGWHFAVKYAVDRVLAAGFLLLTLPVLAPALLAVWLTMGRPIFFRQVRVGRDGRRFGCLKLRSMRLPDGETDLAGLPEGTAPGGVEGDDRRTRLGAFLRRTSIDELPQLLNVLKGDMSIVGPRPERPEFVSQFERSVYRYGDRHRVKSGITGWAQVHGLRGKTSITDRAEWDNFYIENFSLWLDLKILVLTVGAVLGAVRQVE
jgi:exopolysaccharide biosynthesis polyprenyl glycosylphosphotransferase